MTRTVALPHVGSRYGRRAVLIATSAALFVLLFAGQAFAASISGVVTDKVTGAPVGGVAITVFRLSGSAWMTSGDASTYTNPDGSYMLPLSQSGSYRLQFVDPFGTYWTQYYHGAIDLSSARDIVLADGQDLSGIDEALGVPAGRIEGTVTDSQTGTPLDGTSGNSYGILCYHTPLGQWADMPGSRFTADASGHFSLTGVAPGRYRVRFLPPWGHAVTYYKTPESGSEPAVVRVMSGQVVIGIDIGCNPAPAAITGFIVDNVTGVGIPNVRPYAYALDPETGAVNFLSASGAPSGADGRFSIYSLEPKEYSVRFAEAGGAHATIRMNLVAGGSPTTIRLVPTSRITGRVTDGTTGLPLANVEARAYQFQDGVYQGSAGLVQTGSDGSYTIQGIGAGTYRVVFRDPKAAYASEAYGGFPGLEYGALGRDISVGSGTVTGIDGALGRAAHVLGRVTDSSGAPLEGISVQAYMLANGLWSPVNRLSFHSTADGTYDVGGLYPGTYRVRFSDDTGTYSDRYYPSRNVIEQATDIVVSAGAAETGKDCQMGGTSADEASVTVTPGTIGSGASATLAGGITVTFSDAGDGGAVTARPISTLDKGQPANFSLLGQLMDISTTVPFAGIATISMPYDPATASDPAKLKLYHYDNGQWVDITTSVDTVAHQVTGRTTSFSPFGLMGPSGPTSGGPDPDPPVVSTPASSDWSVALFAVFGSLMAGHGLFSRRRSTVG